MRNGQCNCRGQVFKPPTDSRCLNLYMMTTFQVSKWFIYQKHKLNGAHRNREFDLNSPFISGNKVQGIQNQRSVSLSSTRSKMILLSLKTTTHGGDMRIIIIIIIHIGCCAVFLGFCSAEVSECSRNNANVSQQASKTHLANVV
jgi:hypothetical protein